MFVYTTVCQINFMCNMQQFIKLFIRNTQFPEHTEGLAFIYQTCLQTQENYATIWFLPNSNCRASILVFTFFLFKGSKGKRQANKWGAAILLSAIDPGRKTDEFCLFLMDVFLLHLPFQAAYKSSLLMMLWSSDGQSFFLRTCLWPCTGI